MTKKILYVDMDNVLVDFPAAIKKLDTQTLIEYEGRLDEVPGIFSLMPPIAHALESYAQLSEWFDTYSFLPHLGRILPHGATNYTG